MTASAAYLRTVLLALVVLGVIAFLVARWRIRLPRAGSGPRVPSIRVESAQGLGPRHRLVLVECGGRRYLLGLAGGGIVVIDRFVESHRDVAGP